MKYILTIELNNDLSFSNYDPRVYIFYSIPVKKKNKKLELIQHKCSRFQAKNIDIEYRIIETCFSPD